MDGEPTELERREEARPVPLGERILALKGRDVQYETVEVPEWREARGDPPVLRVRGLTGTERDQWEGEMVKELPGGRGRTRMDYSNVRARMVARSVVDDSDQRVFNDRQIQALGQMSASALERIFQVCQRLSRLTDEDIENLTGESKGAQNGASGLTSQSLIESP